jgi:hypothetical protein
MQCGYKTDVNTGNHRCVQAVSRPGGGSARTYARRVSNDPNAPAQPADPHAGPADPYAAPADLRGTRADPHRIQGAHLFNDTWRLMELEDRDPDEDAQMVHQAHASAWHWLQVAPPEGGPERAARGEWQCSRVYCLVGRGEPAIYHAQRVLDICTRHGIGDWDLGYAYEALARAHLVAGDVAATRQWLARAEAQLAEIADEEDRDHLRDDLATVRPPLPAE